MDIIDTRRNRDLTKEVNLVLLELIKDRDVFTNASIFLHMAKKFQNTVY